jgi:hypothetical protein
MPKRVVDGDALWTSEKLTRLRPEHQAEYAYLIPLAQGNGTFRCEARLIWTQAYVHSRPHVTVQDVAAALDDFEQARMLFRWRAEDGKTWGYWVGIEEPGRLPPPSQRGKTDGPLVPKDQLKEFLATPYPEPRRSLGTPYPDPTPGFGFGFGFGFGKGSGYGGGAGGSAPASEGEGSGDPDGDCAGTEPARDSSFSKSKDNSNDAPPSPATPSLVTVPASDPVPAPKASPAPPSPKTAAARGPIVNPAERQAQRRPASTSTAPHVAPQRPAVRSAAKAEPWNALDFAMTCTAPFADLEPRELRRVVFYHWKIAKPYWSAKQGDVTSPERLEQVLDKMAAQTPDDFKVPGSATVILPYGPADPNCPLCGGTGGGAVRNEAYEGVLADAYRQWDPCACVIESAKHQKPWKTWKKDSDD